MKTLKLIETLTEQDITKVAQLQPVGLFKTLFDVSDSWYGIGGECCANYYFQRSGLKTISPAYKRFIEQLGNDDGSFSMGKLIRTKCLDKWTKVYSSLTANYEVLTSKEDTTTRTGTVTDDITYGSSTESNGKTASNVTTTTSTDNSDEVYGFNSTNPVGDNKSTEQSTETITSDADKNTSYNKQSKTGSDTKNNTYNETVKNQGRDRPASSLIDSEIKMRDKWLFFNIVCNDIDEVATLAIYER